MKSINWDDIRYFLALAEAGGLSAAARTLSVEHSTVARRVDMLERELEVKLFDRLPRRWRLTEDGQNLLEPARRMASQAQSFTRIADGMSGLSGSVRISTPPLLASLILAPHLGELRKQLPHIELELVGDLQNADLHEREADIALRMRRPEEPDLAARPLAKLQYGLYGGHDYLATRSQEQWEYVGYERSMQFAPQQQWLDTLPHSPLVFRSNDLNVLASAIVGGVGVGVLPCFMERFYPQLQPIQEPACPIVRELWLVIHPDLRRSPRVRKVADALIALFETGVI
ncbi:LysR family transcriptional regulator [Hahella sp. HN01]|uniref:LysR family transcriptional regulator n=1 Tax=Hahella sp. HN01 TaxID=2847262 RepID=UPI001C1EFF0F|nr:LysR family transcriptional regulator [Hahella sp. HN01]MBU6953382.1 LysR family transcriptional regulator [Hahella sp. HN01]